jgi:hypothetical protein
MSLNTVQGDSEKFRLLMEERIAAYKAAHTAMAAE